MSTGSWLGKRYHGMGIGTQMRAAVLHLAFACLHAQAGVSAAYLDNPASLGASRKLGYQDDGLSVHEVQGKQRTSQRLRQAAEQWRSTRREDFTVSGIEACLETFGL